MLPTFETSNPWGVSWAKVHMDKRFLDKFCPKFMGALHYRIVDVSTVKASVVIFNVLHATGQRKQVGKGMQRPLLDSEAV